MWLKDKYKIKENCKMKKELNVHEWLLKAIDKDSIKETLKYIHIEEDCSVATNGKIMNIYSKRLNDLAPGNYDSETLEKIDNIRYPNWEIVIPTNGDSFIEFQINYLVGKEDDILIFKNDKIINQRTEKLVGNYEGETDMKELCFRWDNLKCATNKIKNKFKMNIFRTNAPVIIEINENCKSIVMPKI